MFFFFFSSRRRHTRLQGDWSSDVCSSDLHWSGGMKRNRRHVDAVFGQGLRIDPSIPGYLVSLLAESETSGGLLFSVAPDRARGVIDAFRRHGEEGWEIGEVISEPLLRVTP